jgi:hypothetical protein
MTELHDRQTTQRASEAGIAASDRAGGAGGRSPCCVLVRRVLEQRSRRPRIGGRITMPHHRNFQDYGALVMAELRGAEEAGTVADLIAESNRS